jgi:hypothetical protein
VPTPARCLPALRSASASGSTHHARHEANAAGEPTAATGVLVFTRATQLTLFGFLGAGKSDFGFGFGFGSSRGVLLLRRRLEEKRLRHRGDERARRRAHRVVLHRTQRLREQIGL